MSELEPETRTNAVSAEAIFQISSTQDNSRNHSIPSVADDLGERFREVIGKVLWLHFGTSAK